MSTPTVLATQRYLVKLRIDSFTCFHLIIEKYNSPELTIDDILAEADVHISKANLKVSEVSEIITLTKELEAPERIDFPTAKLDIQAGVAELKSKSNPTQEDFDWALSVIGYQLQDIQRLGVCWDISAYANRQYSQYIKDRNLEEDYKLHGMGYMDTTVGGNVHLKDFVTKLQKVARQGDSSVITDTLSAKRLLDIKD